MQPPLRRRRRIEQPLRAGTTLRYDTLSDHVLVRRAKDRDHRALEELCARHRPRLERLARHVLGDTEDASDAVQEALVKLCAGLGRFRGESSFSTWLHRVALNACRDVAAREARRRCEPLEEDARPAPGPGPERSAELAELRADLAARLRAIPADQARVVVLKDVLGLSFEEVAGAADMPVGTAKCYAHRGRAALRDSLAGAPAA